MMKKIFKTAAFIFSIITLAAVFSCGMEVGLGSAVDTDAPTVEISYPPKNAIVRSSFVLAGVCDDDLALDYVEVKVTETSTKKEYGPYKALLSEDCKAWSLLLNQKLFESRDAYDAYKQWEFPDGNYVITAISYDKNQKASQEATLPLSIDNTAPVLIVSKPLAFGTENASVYGRTVNIIGDISEEHETEKLILYYKEYDVNNPASFASAETKSLEISGFGTMSSDSPLTIAKYYTNTNQQTDASILTDNYRKIYGTEVNLENSIKKTFYCGFQLEDNAREYTNPKDTGSGTGNKTTQYYILSDDFNSRLFSDEAGYALNARNLMLLLNGKSSYTETQQNTIIEFLKQTGYSASSSEIKAENSSKFSVDPKNNPVWSITNFGFNEGTFDTYEIGSAVPLVLKAGGDGIAIDKDTIEIELYYLGDGATPGTIDAANPHNTPHLTLVRQGEYVDGKLKEALNYNDGNGLRFLDSNEEVISNDPTSPYAGLKINHWYEFRVKGADGTGNEISPEGDLRYGFKRYSNFAGPRLSFVSDPNDTDSYLENEFYSGSKLDTDGITIRGIIVTADSTVSITDENKIEVKQITAVDTRTNEPTVIASDAYDYDITDLQQLPAGNASTGKTYSFTANITKKTGSSLAPAAEGSYKYKVIFSAQDSLNEISEDSEFEFKLDTAKPVIAEGSINNITKSPVIDDKVNGVVKISGSVTDVGSGFSQLKYGTGDSASASSSGVTVTGSSWSFNFDTTPVALAPENHNIANDYTINLKIFAIDLAGNEGEITVPLTVNQNTDKPRISFTNNSSIFTDTNNVLVGNVSDDDGLAKITASYRKTSPGTPENPDNAQSITLDGTASDGRLNQTTTSFGLNIKLQDASGNELPEGEYEIEIRAEDTENAQFSGNPIGKNSRTITVKKDNSAPVFKITSPKSTKDTYYSASVPVSGTVKDGSGEVTITRKVYKINRDTEEEIEQIQSLDYPPASASPWIIKSDAVYGNDGATWSDSLSISEQSNGTYKVVYTAKDKYASEVTDNSHTSTQTLVFSVDRDIPTIEEIQLNGSPLALENDVATGWLNRSYGEFKVRAIDTIGVASVKYSQDDNQHYSNMSLDEDEGVWTANVNFTGNNPSKEIYIKATDEAGNDSVEKHFTLKIDVHAPTLEVSGLSGIVHVNNTLNATANSGDGNDKVSVTVDTYSDGTNESEIKPLKFYIGSSEITPAGTPTAGSAGSTIYTFNKTKIPPSNDPQQFKVVGEDNAGNKVTKDICSFIVDTTDPEINDISLVMTGGSVYKDTASGDYYIRNTQDGTLTISGTVEEDYFDRIELKVNGATPSGVNPVTTASWSFAGIDLSSLTNSATITLTAYDKAGNGEDAEKALTIKFDESAPVIVTGKGPDNRYTFRGEDVEKFNNLYLGQGRYSKSSYGRENALDFTVYVKEEGSGLSRLEYKLYDADKATQTEAQLRADFATGTDWSASGTFNLTTGQSYSYYDSDPDSSTYRKTVSGTGIKATASISGFKKTTGDKTNYLLICPIDNCGTPGEIVVLSVHVDQTVPKVVATNSEQLTNGTKAIDLSGSVYDIDAGLKALRVLINNEVVINADLTSISVSGANPNASLDSATNVLTVPNTDANKALTVTAKNAANETVSPLSNDAVTVTFTNNYGVFKYTGTKADTTGTLTAAGTEKYSLASAASYAEWELKLTPDQGTWFNALGTRPVVAIEAEDWAESNGSGNIDPNPTSVAVLNKDKDLPTVTIVSPAGGVNGEYNVTGTSRDETSKPETLKLYYSKAATKPTVLSDFTEYASKSTTGAGAVNVSRLLNYSFTVDFYERTASDNPVFIADDAETQDIWILVVATDQAGNTSVDPDDISADAIKKFTIDRNTDRPTVAISEINLGSMESGDYTKLYLGSKQIFINVSDDDGVKTAEYRVTAQNATPDDNGWQAITLKGGSSGNFRLANDGPQTIEFRITDKNDTVFVSSATPDWKKIYVQDTFNHKFGDYTNDTHTAVTAPAIYATLDTEAPSVELLGITVSATVAADVSSTEWELPADFDKILGGASPYVYLKVSASDAGSGIASVSANSVSTSTLTNGVCILQVPCSTGDGVFDITITATDKAGRTRSIGKQFDIDNTAPTINIESPSSTSEQSGNGSVTAFGWFTESVKLSYTISPIATYPDDYEANTAFTFIKNGETPAVNFPVNDKADNRIIPSGSGLTAASSSADYSNYLKTVCDYEDYSTENVSNFTLYFDGGDTTGHSYQLNTWLTKMGITTAADLAETDPAKWFDDIITLYLQLRAEDDAGNVTYCAYPILVDPQGNRPKVEFSYPNDKMNDATLHAPILGGTIDIRGSAIGVNPMNKVYMQIDADGDGDWDADDEAYLTTNGKKIYTLVNIPGMTGKKGIEIPVSGTFWNQKINENSEFDPETQGELKKINIRLYAKDSQGLTSSAKTKTIWIDNDVPVIGQNKWLVKWKTGKSFANGLKTNANGDIDIDANGNFAFADGAVEVLREYGDDMYLAGEWYLVGMVSDDSGISIINIDGTKNEANHTNLIGDSSNSDYLVRGFEDGSHTNYIFCLKIGSSSGVVKSEIPFYAKDNDNGDKYVEKTFVINSDNVAPSVTELSNNLEIYNDNGFYNFGSTATENSSGSVNQSGVERVAFYFTREAIGTQGAAGYTPAKILDPMMKPGVTGNAVNLAYYTLDTTDGLYWKTVSATVNGSVVTLATVDPNVHKYGLIKVNGTIYRIEAINNNTVLTLSGSAGTATSVQLTIANVIDNTISEDVTNMNSRTDDWGYGYPPAQLSSGKSIYDDGDLMPEHCRINGAQCNWKAWINSKNMTDGKVTLHYIVFDKAGNAAVNTVNAKVQNNAPRIAGAYIGTDEDGNGSVDEDKNEFISYHNINPKGLVNGRKAVNVEITANAKNGSRFTIKRKTVIKPEIVGGNGDLYYSYSVGSYDSKPNVTKLGEGNGSSDNIVTLDDKGTLPSIELDVIDFLNNNIADGTNKDFAFTIWDSTPGLTPGDDSQSATLHVTMDVALNDTTPAQNKIIPFYWKSKTINSLADNSLEKGHIELSKELPEDYFGNDKDGIYKLNPKVSGAIKLEGIAKDNSLLSELKVAISTYDSGNAFTIATYSNTGDNAGTWDEKTGTGWSTVITKATYGQLVAAGYITAADIPEDCDEDTEAPYASQELGHVVHWTLTMDTDAMGITPAAGIEISAYAIDYGKPSTTDNINVNYNDKNNFRFNGAEGTTLDDIGQTGGDDGTTAHTCKYLVDVVPYIRGIKTYLSRKSSNKDSSEKDRTALGHYPVASTETIYLYGFNLAGGTLYDKENHTAELGEAIVVNNNATLKDIDSYKGFTLYPAPAASIGNFTSGEITVKYGTGANAIESLNNKNLNNARGEYGGESFTLPAASNYGKRTTKNTFSNFYNRKPNSENNYILTDDVILDVWKINNNAGQPRAGGRIDELTMKISPSNGIVGFTFLNGPKDWSRPKGSSTSYSYGTRKYGSQEDSHTTAALAYDDKGNAFALNAGGNEGDPVHFEILTSGGGNTTSVYIEYVNQKTKRDGTGGYLDLRYKVKSPNIVTSPNGTDTNIYMVYYDSYNDEIRYKYGSMNNIINDQNGRDLFHARNNNAASWNNNNDYTCEYAQVIATDATKNLPTITQNGTTVINPACAYTGTPLGGAGEFVDIAVIPAGTVVNSTELTDDVVVVVWDDGGNLKYAYNPNPRDYSWHNNNSITAEYRGLNRQNWTGVKTIFTGASEYCQVKVDVNGGVHIAAYDRVSGDLRYAYLSTYNITTYNESKMSYKVDSAGATGSHMRMDVALNAAGNPVPYISYWGSNMPKIAYLKADSAASGTVDDMFNGNWEVSYIPTSSKIDNLDAKKDKMNVDNRINVGVWKYTTGDDKGKIKDSSTGTASNATNDGKIYGNGKATPMVSYSVQAPNDTANNRIETAQMQ